MAVFEYRGLVVASGKQVHGIRDADNAKVLRSALKREGILLTSAQEDTKAQKDKGKKLDLGALLRRVSVTDVAMMTRQLATLVTAGIPLVECVTALTEQVDKHELKRVLTQVRDRLNEGSSLAKALEPHPDVFPPLYVNMVGAGEASGTLEIVLTRLSDFMENQARLRGKVGAALAYPAIMLIMGGVLISIMMIVVVPKVTSIYATLDRALPIYTQILIAGSTALGSTEMLGFLTSSAAITSLRRGRAAQTAAPEKRLAWNFVAGVAGLFLVTFLITVESTLAYCIGIAMGLVFGYGVSRFTAYLDTPAGRFRKDTFLLRIPIFGHLLRMIAVTRFARTLATLLQSGVPLLKAMDIVKNVLDNARLSKVIEEAIGSIREGESIAQPLKRSGDFPPIVTHMIAVGEKSGQLETMLENVARAYDTQIDTRVQALTSLLEPLMMIVMGGAVGFIAISILMPLVQMNDFVQ
jgi:general secretion pathway protein F